MQGLCRKDASDLEQWASLRIIAALDAEDATAA